MATIKRNFRSNLVSILSTDNLRPNLQCIHIKGGFIYGSNGHIGLKQDASLHDLFKDDIKNLEGKSVHSSVLKMLKQHDWVEFQPEVIRAKIKNTTAFVNYPYYVPETPMYDLEKIISDASQAEKDLPELKIGVNPRLLNSLYSAMITTSQGVCLDMFSANKTILIKSTEHDNQVGIIMPVLFHSEYGYRSKAA